MTAEEVWYDREGEFDLDLSRFEENHRSAFDNDGPGNPAKTFLSADGLDDVMSGWPGENDTIEAEEIEVDRAPWDDRQDYGDLYSAESIWKGKLLIDSGKVEKINDKHYVVSGSQSYTVNILPSEGMRVPWAVCTCPNGSARGGRPSCYHTAAALALVLGYDLSHLNEPPKGKRPARR
jgi:uncharacterized Zn finger protein